jgi:hypothetical protein
MNGALSALEVAQCEHAIIARIALRHVRTDHRLLQG